MVNGKLSAEPNPATEGSQVEVTYTGGDVVYYSVDGDSWTELPVDPKTGEGTITIPAGSNFVTISDRKIPEASTVCVEVMRTSR